MVDQKFPPARPPEKSKSDAPATRQSQAIKAELKSVSPSTLNTRAATTTTTSFNAKSKTPAKSPAVSTAKAKCILSAPASQAHCRNTVTTHSSPVACTTNELARRKYRVSDVVGGKSLL